MITAIEIENFKGIGDRTRIEIKPITLLFGPNSAGKSTVFHAIQYAQEVFLRHNLDVERPVSGGGLVDLGGFRSLVHGRDTDRVVSLRFSFDTGVTGDWDLDAITSVGPYYHVVHLSEDHLPKLAKQIRDAVVEVEIAWSELHARPYVRRYSVEANGQPVAAIVCELGKNEVHLTAINACHPLFGSEEDQTVLEQVVGDFEGSVPRPEDRYPISDLRDALPTWKTGLAIDVDPDTDWKILSRDKGQISMTLSPIAPNSERFVALFSHLFVSVGMRLCDYLEAFTYLGPIREAPPRRFQPPIHPQPGRWANGLAAWDLLYANNPDEVDLSIAPHDHCGLVETTNDWLHDPERLNTGYGLKLIEWKEIPLDSPLAVAVRADRMLEYENIRRDFDRLPTRRRLAMFDEKGLDVQPQDIGIGITQLVPVVVMTLTRLAGIAAIEQPELHLHPAVQVRLGDLIIHGSEGRYRQFMIETHSEYLLLRLLRRVRQTTEKTLPPGHPGLTADKLAVMCFEPPSGSTTTRVYRLRIDDQGEFLDPWPRGFFDERAEELFGS
jgi:hypothetical protein